VIGCARFHGPLGVVTREAEPHRHDRDPLWIVEGFFADPEPASQPDARRIGIGASRGMDPDAGRLTCDPNPPVWHFIMLRTLVAGNLLLSD
jgi:hypothetical protein